jgi:hypothetical protein
MSKLRDFAFKLIIAAIVLIGHYLADENKQSNSPLSTSLRQQVVAAETSLQSEGVEFSRQQSALHILPKDVRLPSHRVNDMLRGVDGKHNPVVYYYHDNLQRMVYSMSASDIADTHHLVNNFLQGYKPFDVDNVALPLYVLAQRKSYLLDEKQYFGKADVWQSSRQAYHYPRGDCEDHAILLADWLIAMGEDARVALGDVDGQGHAWVVLFKDGKEYLLEATQKRGLSRNKPYPLASLHPNYHPEFMFNRQFFWANSGSKYTTRYSGNHWEQRSRVYAL